MQRKVIKQGNNTLTITLPKNWTDRFGIKAGDEIHLEEKHHALVVSSQASGNSKTITIDIPQGARFHRRLILRPYVKGFDEITLTFQDKDMLPRIADCLSLMIGFEMIEQRERSCVLVNVAKGVEQELDHMFSRLVNVAIDMSQSTMDALAKKEHERLGAVAAMENLGNRLHIFCKRMINRIGRDQADVTSLYRINCAYEEITDFYGDICKAATTCKGGVDKHVLAVLASLHEQLKRLRIPTIEYDTKKLEEIINHEKRIDQMIKDIMPKNRLDTAIIIAAAGINESIHAISEELF